MHGERPCLMVRLRCYYTRECVPARAGSLAFCDYAFFEARLDASWMAHSLVNYQRMCRGAVAYTAVKFDHAKWATKWNRTGANAIVRVLRVFVTCIFALYNCQVKRFEALGAKGSRLAPQFWGPVAFQRHLLQHYQMLENWGMMKWQVGIW